MEKRNQQQESYKNILRIIKNFFSNLLNNYYKYAIKYSTLYEIVALTLIYFIAITNLKSSLPNIEESPFEILVEIFPYLENLEKIKFPKIFSISTSAEFSYLIYLLVMEVVVTRGGILGFPLLVRYHIIYVLILESIFSVLINLWDALIYVEVRPLVYYDANSFVSQVFYHLLFWIFTLIYLSGYIFALRKKLPILPFFQKIPDSVTFWLKIKKKNK